MLWILSQLKSLLKALNDGQTPKQIALGVVFGLFLGFPPFNILFFLIILLLLLIINANITMAFLLMGILKLIVGYLDPIADILGTIILVEITWLKGIWTWLYNLPLIPYSNFNNTVMMGTIFLAALLAFPTFLLSEYLIDRYQKQYREKIMNLHIMKLLKASKVAGFFSRLN